MWFRLFVLLRIPISVIALIGFAAVEALGALFPLVACVFLAFVSVRLIRLRPGSLQLACLLLALEVAGAVSLVGASDYTATRHVDVGYLFAWACICIVLWVAPNAAVLYKARGLFTANKKPDDQTW
jgi:hypothetical protein